MTRIMKPSMTDDQFKQLFAPNNAQLLKHIDERSEQHSAILFGPLSRHFDEHIWARALGAGR